MQRLNTKYKSKEKICVFKLPNKNITNYLIKETNICPMKFPAGQ